MPRAKSRCKPKTVRCPHCGKKFGEVNSVLQHLSQPLGSCFGKSLFELDSLPSDNDSPSDDDSLMEPSPDDLPSATGSGDTPDVDELSQHDEDIDMADVDMSHPPRDPPAHIEVESDQTRFVEMFEGCAMAFPGGTTFMNDFWDDQYASQRRENLYFPWMSKEEWAFTSWLLQSRLSMAAINDLLSLRIIRNVSLSFRTAKELRSRAEILPGGPKWVCEMMKPSHPVKRPVHLFYRNPIKCLQALLSHPQFERHIPFVPRKVWTSAAKICRIYDEWLSGDRAWKIQEELPQGSTLLGVVLASDKTNISVMSGNRMAYPLLISLANIDASIRCKTSLHAYLLIALLPVAKFTHKTTRVRSRLQDRLVHEALNIVLAPLKTAQVGVMMSDPVGNLRYCFTPIAAWIADTPEESLLLGTGPKVSPVTVALSKQFGDARRHELHTSDYTLAAICTACSEYSPNDYEGFLKAAKRLGLNGVINLVWKRWLLSQPCYFITPEVLHHFFRFVWDHNIQWCIKVVGAAEMDFRFTLIQMLTGYRGFDEGISKLKQVTGRDHRSIQCYIIGAAAGKAPRRFLIAVRALVDFRYLAQAPVFTAESLKRVASALQEFHDHKDAIVQSGVRDGWEIPKLELLQSVVPSIQQSGAVIQWSADVTEHAHVDVIKEPARAGNNQNYYNQIARHLDQLERCHRFDLATYIEEHTKETDGYPDDKDEDHEPDGEKCAIAEYSTLTCPMIDYFSISQALIQGLHSSAPKPFRTFATATTAFCLATKPSSRLSLGEAALKYGLPDLVPSVTKFFEGERDTSSVDDWRLQIWHKVRVQQKTYHKKTLDSPQTLRAIPPTDTNLYDQYDSSIISPQNDSDWPKSSLAGHSVAQLRIIFRILSSDQFLVYVQHFRIVPQDSPTNTSAVTGMHVLKRAIKSNGQRVGEIIPITLLRSPAHLIPHFGPEAHPRLTKGSSYELSTEFWLNKYWSKESYYALSPELT